MVTAARRSAWSGRRDARERARAASRVQGRRRAGDGAGIVTGCNVENATYGLTICAERVAMFKALSDGHRAFTRIAVVADTADPTPPCGACRQILWEFGGNLDVILANLTEETGDAPVGFAPAAVRRAALGQRWSNKRRD